MVDNLWEFTRPADKPSRRHAVYASPTPQLALKNAAAGALAQDQYVACELRFRHAPAMIQLTVSDARDHPDIRKIQSLVNQQLKDWAAGSLQDKLGLAPLFLPGVTQEELASAMAGNAHLDELVRQAAAAVTIWSADPVTVSPDGVLFFEITEDNAYTLHPV
ncbi:hypothetical protein GJV26_16765 [Massilia dura]|uniref:RES domain-containing protein n=1 Tax=Pseudoduganella dura TaxID=321982 RepID=A0A6I3XET4_9BURK|nr:hypothetical protein [Pseudoduganella dura]MUI14096.1 hypothetical protein [Pseudoduganella dura]GGX77149.1 hypothetical protein GCM10007386_05480 [Pseudoduganella dura]